MNKRRIIPLLIYAVILITLFSWSIGLFSGGGSALSYSQVLQLFEQERVRSFVVEDQTITLELHEPLNGKTKITTTLADPETFRLETRELLHAQLESGVLAGYDFVPEKGFSPSQLIFPLLTVGIILLLLWALFMSRMSGGGNPASNFGKARTVLGIPDGKKVTFADVAGADEEKEELKEVVDFLRSPKKYT